MKLAGLTLYKVPPRWVFLKLTTDTEISGWGEPVIEGRSDTVITAVKEFWGYLQGKDPMKIEDHWQYMYRGGFYRGGPEVMGAISGIDQALWDIKGKYYNAPVYDLLGGACRDKIRVYRWIGGDLPSNIAENAKLAVEEGFDAIKMNATSEMHYIDNYKKIDEVCERIQAIRDAVGNKLDIAVDFHGRAHKPMAKILAKELSTFRLMFIEEPVLSQNNEALREIARVTATPIATGERMFSRWEFKNILEDGYVDIIQPDLSHAGGISECKKIAVMAEAYDVAVAPHCPLGPIALGSCFALDSCTPNVFIQEQSMGYHFNKGGELLEYLEDTSIYQYKNGYIDLIDRPGLGVRMNEEKIQKAALKYETWKNPVWRNYDGTIAEW